MNKSDKIINIVYILEKIAKQKLGRKLYDLNNISRKLGFFLTKFETKNLKIY